MNPLSLVRHLALLGLAYAALVAETSVVPQLSPGGATFRPLWIVLALVVVGNHGVIRLEGAELAAEIGLNGDAFAGAEGSWLDRVAGSNTVAGGS